jgi:hypothetical protein
MVWEGEKSDLHKTQLMQRDAKQTTLKNQELFIIRSKVDLLDYPYLKIILLAYNYNPGDMPWYMLSFFHLPLVLSIFQ